MEIVVENLSDLTRKLTITLPRETVAPALEKAYAHIARHPATGSPRYAHELNLPGLRDWPLTRYPHLVFYVEHPDQIDVWRVLHGQRDIPAWMQEPDAV